MVRLATHTEMVQSQMKELQNDMFEHGMIGVHSARGPLRWLRLFAPAPQRSLELGRPSSPRSRYLKCLRQRLVVGAVGSQWRPVHTRS